MGHLRILPLKFRSSHIILNSNSQVKMFKQILLLTLVGFALAAPGSISKVEPRLALTLRTKNRVNIFVKFVNGNRDIIQSINTQQFATRGEKITHLVAQLKSKAQASQGNALSMLQSGNVKQFWISNELFVKGASLALINQLESLPEVTEIREELIIRIDDSSVKKVQVANGTQWNLGKIEADNAWGLPGGNNGQGVVVSNIDTGTRHTHEALRNNFRADYGWFDAYDGTEVPRDTEGHGTHTIGSIAGAGIGVAPGAQWIACQGCSFIFCSEEALKACGQWILCPTRPNGTDADCSKAPNVVSNSWGFSPGNNPFYNEVTDAWKAADIIPVFGMGNEGPACSRTRSPGDQDVIGVGSTTQEDTLSDFSSPGPAADNVRKPDVSAPGSLINSSLSDADDSYGLSSGTSMATPHVAGAVALLLSRNPNLNYTEVKEILEKTVDTSSLGDTGRECGALNSTVFPNNHYGYGRLNARKALESVINNY